MEGSLVSVVNGLASFIQNGGVFMWVILFVWVVGIAISFERFPKVIFCIRC